MELNFNIVPKIIFIYSRDRFPEAISTKKKHLLPKLQVGLKDTFESGAQNACKIRSAGKSVPSLQTPISSNIQRLKLAKKPTNGHQRQIPIHIEKEILNLIEKDATRSTRSVTRETDTSIWVVHRT